MEDLKKSVLPTFVDLLSSVIGLLNLSSSLKYIMGLGVVFEFVYFYISSSARCADSMDSPDSFSLTICTAAVL